MRRTLLFMCLISAAAVATAAPPAKSAFEKLRALLGVWKGHDSQGSGVTATFRLIGDETALMESLVRGEAGESIIRVYYVDNGTLMLTQYGTRGNQPRMRIDAARSGESAVVFRLLDVTNAAGGEGTRILDLILSPSGKSLLTESWTVRSQGMDSVETAVLARTSLGEGGAAIERMKSLLGTWKGKDQHGNRVDVTYAMVADSTAMMESLDVGGTKESMVTVYTLDGGNTVLTHYCSMGNQPRMRLDASESSDDALVFRYVDATNVKSERDPRMHDLTLRFRDRNHFSQEWFLRIEGKSTSAVYEFDRVMPPQEQSSSW